MRRTHQRRMKMHRQRELLVHQRVSLMLPSTQHQTTLHLQVLELPSQSQDHQSLHQRCWHQSQLGHLACEISRQNKKAQQQVQQVIRNTFQLATMSRSSPPPALISGSGCTLYFLQIFKYIVCSCPTYLPIRLSISSLGEVRVSKSMAKASAQISHH